MEDTVKRRRRARFKHSAATIAVLLVLVLMLLLLAVNKSMRPAMISMAEARIRSITMKAMNQAILDNMSDEAIYSELIDIYETGEKVYMLKANTRNMNILAADCATAAQEQISKIGEQAFPCPSAPYPAFPSYPAGGHTLRHPLRRWAASPVRLNPSWSPPALLLRQATTVLHRTRGLHLCPRHPCLRLSLCLLFPSPPRGSDESVQRTGIRTWYAADPVTTSIHPEADWFLRPQDPVFRPPKPRRRQARLRTSPAPPTLLESGRRSRSQGDGGSGYLPAKRSSPNAPADAAFRRSVPVRADNLGIATARTPPKSGVTRKV